MPGMTVWAWPLGSCWRDDALRDAIEDDDKGRDGEDDAALVEGLGIELGGRIFVSRVGIIAGSIWGRHQACGSVGLLGVAVYGGKSMALSASAQRRQTVG